MTEEVFIGGYKRVNVLQTGQNSQVWQVTEPGSNRQFAAKLLLDGREGDSDQIKALKREADTGRKLEHPRLIRTYSYSKDRGRPFILMEFFPSQNLKLRLLNKQFEERLRPRLRQIIEQVAQALEYLHSLHYVHRDIKPDNILMNGSGEIRLIDFALAIKEVSGLAKLFARKSRLTAGTRSYMSPEQIRGLNVDCRADMYSFGIVLYELISGRVPFVANSGSELLKKHLAEAPPTFDPSLELTPEFQELIFSMLEKKPADRPQSPTEFLTAFRRVKIYNMDEENENQG